MSDSTKSSRTKRVATVLAGVAVAPLAMIALSAPAQAAELTPIAEYLDTTVADTEAQLGGALDALGLEAAE